MTRLLIHDKLRERGSPEPRWQVLGAYLVNGRIKAYDLRENREVYLLHSQINADVDGGALIVDRVGAPRIPPIAQNDPKFLAALALAGKQFAHVEKLRNGMQVSINVAYTQAVQAGELPMPSRATMYRRAARRRKGLPLLAGNKNKGNRTPRYSEELRSLVCSLLESLYLVEGSPYTLLKMRQVINDQAHEANLLPVSKKLSREYIGKVLATMTPDPGAARMDPKELPAARSVGGERIIVTRPFERVEQDAVHLPFRVRVGDEVVSNLYWVHAVDCATSVPLGWHLSVLPPNESRGLKCIESILFSKRSAFERLGLSYDFDPCGTPDLLVMDNGPETSGERFDKLESIGITVQNLPAAHPSLKPYIERLNRSLKEALETLPGSTRHNGNDGIRDPEALGDELMTLEELETWIVRWYFETWITVDLKRHVRDDIHEDVKLGSSPKARWLRMTGDLGFAIQMSPRRKSWEMCLYERCEAKLNRKSGLPARGLRYRGAKLEYLVNKYGEETHPFCLDPDDYRHIFVWDGDDEDWVILTEENVTETSPAYTFDDYKAKCAAAEMSKDSPEAVAFRRDVSNASVRGKKPRRSRKQQNADAVAKEKERDARNRAAASPPVAPLAPAPIPFHSPSPAAAAAPVNERRRRLALDQVQGNRILNRETGENL